MITHLPEVVLHVASQNMIVSDADSLPVPSRFIIWLQPSIRLALEVSDVQSVRIQSIDLRQQLPRVSDGFLLEVVSERPISKHLKERVMVAVLTYVVQIVVLTTRTDTFLRVDGAFQLCKVGVWSHSPLEDGLVLVHAGIGEQQCGIRQGDHGRTGNEGVALFLEVAVEVSFCSFYVGPIALSLIIRMTGPRYRLCSKNQTYSMNVDRTFNACQTINKGPRDRVRSERTVHSGASPSVEPILL